MRRSASEKIRDLELRVSAMEMRTASLASNRFVQEITSILGDGGRPNGSKGWNWSPITTRGDKVSLYYEESYGDEVEVSKPPRYMGVSTDSFGIGYIAISDLRKFF